MDKKKLARMEMLRKLARKGREEDAEPSLKEALKKKKLSKVEVISDSKEGLTKGLSKAQEILKAKLGDKLLSEDDSDDMHDEDCDICEGHGCEYCEEEEEDEEE